MAADQKMIRQVLSALPQQAPFRFIDDVLELDEDHIVGAYRFRRDEYFYDGHFPGHPVTPGVILVETMAQTGVVAFGLYLTMQRQQADSRVMPDESLKGMITLFTLADNVEFSGMVMPGERVIVRGEKMYFRRSQLKVKVQMSRENDEIVCSGVLAGMGVKQS